MNTLQKLPIGIQTFSEIVDNDYLYIDKTRQIHRLLNTGKYFFLSRPRRFGKSLTLSTIKSIYQGKRELFDGLWIADQWDWEQVHPVIHISFSSIGHQSLGLEAAIEAEIRGIARSFDLELVEQEISRLFRELIKALSTRAQVVILIDEYDKPIIDYLDDVEKAKENQAILHRFYSVVKDSDPYIEFFLITGISKFSKVSIFSELNNLTDLTLNRHFADLTGYTQSELENAFTPYLPEVEEFLGVDRSELLARLRDWYDGYTWDGKIHVYNPFSILNFFNEGDFRSFWFETGTPTFLLKLLREQETIELDELELSELAFSTYDVEHLNVLPILFQTGYLTIKSREEFDMYKLGYPNTEVKNSMLMYLISDFGHMEPALTSPMVIQLYHAFNDCDVERIIQIIKTIFKNIPSQIFISKAESYYHSLIYLVFFYLGQYAESEVNTSNGRLDCMVQTDDHIFILEFKLDQSAEAALAQIKERSYAEKYAVDPRPKILLGINFSSVEKSVDGWLMERVDSDS